MKTEEQIQEEANKTRKIVEKMGDEIRQFGWARVEESTQRYYHEQCCYLRMLEWVLSK